jgi:hypothetical protein
MFNTVHLRILQIRIGQRFDSAHQRRDIGRSLGKPLCRPHWIH